MPLSPSFQPPPVRRGVTLLELLVVLVLMGIAAAGVAPALRPPLASRAGDGRGPADVDELIATARRTAIRRGEPLRLRVATDGVWALVAFRDGTLLSGGRLAAATRLASRRRDATPGTSARGTALDLRIDAMGSCMPAGALDAQLNANRRVFDPLTCTVSTSQ